MESLSTPHSAPADAFRNVRMMHVLEHIAVEFNKADVPLMVLKGAALNLLVYDRPISRPMDDLDVLVRAEHVDAARRILTSAGARPGAAQVREDFFPRLHYEAEYIHGTVYPVKIDLHVRPWRPLRYAVTVPPDALWQDVREVPLGDATVHVPSPENMLIHLAVHLAIHGDPRPKWLEDIRLWLTLHRETLNWDKLISRAQAWGVVLPLRNALGHFALSDDHPIPARVAEQLRSARVNWRDRLALWQAPRDALHPLAHVAVNVLCTPSWPLRRAYLAAVLFPDRAGLADSTAGNHSGSLFAAHLRRLASPFLARFSRPLRSA